MALTKFEVIQINATVIVGVLVLLSVTQIADISKYLESQQVDNAEEFNILLDPIYLVTFVTALFSISAVIEILFLIMHSFNYSKKVQDKSNLQEIPKDAPQLASPLSLIFMGAGFLWLTATIILYAISKFISVFPPIQSS